jgi:hypothetical protein
MTVQKTDPHSRALRGEISGAMRAGDTELAEELRQQLRLRNIETAVVRQLEGAPRLTAVQLRYLRKILESYGPQTASRAS